MNHLLRVYYVHEVLALRWLESDSGESECIREISKR